MNKHFKLIYLFLLLFSWSVPFVKAQTTFASEDALKKHAAKLFEEEDFENAIPLYSQLVSNYPKDPNYNYRLGVCFLYASGDKEKSLSFLEFAVNKLDVEKEVHYYLGKAYHLNYRFDDAIAQYKTYLKIASAKNIEKLQVQRQIEMCVNGKKLLRNLSDLVVIEKKEMNKEDFFRSYDISEIGGKLLVKPDEKEFKTSLDKKKKEQSIIYLAKDKSQIYFSSYGLENTNGKDIYVIKKLPSKDSTNQSSSIEWGKPQALGNIINTKYDEDYPFLHPNGKVLYFSSKGHNSMGGYDIFKSQFNEETKTWNTPENMDFPINTPDDDILYVTDSSEKEAYFSSARSSVSGKISVYHINVERKPIDVVIIKGNVIKNRNNQALDLKITVKDLASNNILGIYNSSPDNGSYSLELPNGGSFSFTVEAADFTTQSEVVVIPVQYKFNPMQQEISYDLVTSKLKIKNSFGETNEDENYLLALNYIKNKAKLDVSLTSLVPIDSLKADRAIDVTATKQKSEISLANKKLSNDDIVKIADEDAKDVDAEAKELREQADIALSLANQKNELAQNKSKEASAYMTEASKTDDIVKKEELFDKSENASAESKQLNQETVTAFNLAKKLDATAFKKQEEADASQQYAKGLEAAIKSDNPTEALAKMDDQEKKLEELNRANAGASSISNNLKTEADSKQRELNTSIKTSGDIKQEMVDNETVISNLKLDIEKTKNEELKQGLENQIGELNEENSYKKIELQQNEIKVAKLKKEYDGVLNEVAMVNTIINQSKTESNETALAGVASIDKNKLEQQVNNITGVTPTNNGVTSSTGTSDNTKSVITKSETPTVAKLADNEKSVSNKLKTPTVASTQPVAKLADNEKSVITKSEIPTVASIQPVAKLADNEKSVITKSEIPTVASTQPVVKLDNNEKSVSNKLETTTVAATAKPIINTTDTVKLISSHPEIITTQTSDNVFENINKKYGDELATSEKVNSKTDRDKATADVLQKWSKEINSHIEKQKQKYDTINNPIAKALLAKQINDETISSKEKQTQATESLAAAEKLKQQNAVVAAAIVTPSSPDKTSTTNNNITSETAQLTANTTDDALEKINKKNAADLAVAEKIENKADREKAKATALKMWAEEINAHVEKQKQNYDTTSNAASKALLAKQMSDETASSKEKQTKANESLAAVETLKQNSVATVNNTSPEISTSPNIKSTSIDNTKNETAQLTKKTNDKALDKINKGNADDLAVAEKIVNKQDREKAKSAALKMWADEIETHTADLQQKYWDETDSKKKSLLALQISDAEKSLKEMLSLKNTGIDKPDAIASTKPNAIASAVVLLPNEVFERKSSPAYSAEKPIPINNQLPESLIYKVQIGAFSKPIPQDLFTGISPITGETTPQGFIRYTAGIFKNLTSAENVKNEIQSLGYKDAFVVAFNNGKRISMNEAHTISGETPSASVQANTETIEQDTSVSRLQKLYTDIASRESIAIPVVAEQQKNIAPTKNVTTIGGLFYTVQIGVFAQAVSSSKLFNIQPLYTETSPNGNLRYNIGIYNNLSRAAEAKLMAIDIGIKDAFITAYYNGKRIAMNEAKQYEQDGGAKVFSTAPNINVLPFVQLTQKQNVPENSTDATQQSLQHITQPVNNSEKPSTNTNNAFASDVVFKVQIGAFRNEVPLEIVNQFLKISKFGIENYKDERGLTIYTAGNFKTYNEANKLKQAVVVAESFEGAFVVAYRNGKKIAMDDAKK